MMKTLMEIDYEKDDLTSDIADRAVKLLGGRKIDYLLDVYHAKKGNPDMDLEKLLKASDFDFGHDICGIRKHLNHDTLKFDNCFLPRCMRK